MIHGDVVLASAGRPPAELCDHVLSRAAAQVLHQLRDREMVGAERGANREPLQDLVGPVSGRTDRQPDLPTRQAAVPGGSPRVRPSPPRCGRSRAPAAGGRGRRGWSAPGSSWDPGRRSGAPSPRSSAGVPRRGRRRPRRARSACTSGRDRRASPARGRDRRAGWTAESSIHTIVPSRTRDRAAADRRTLRGAPGGEGPARRARIRAEAVRRIASTRGSSAFSTTHPSGRVMRVTVAFTSASWSTVEMPWRSR